ncbi:adenosine kinase [Actinosynnema sp. ALI-1.44]|uniref:adenosine kinase n=1 Tax=Actinosynnema sp. ALI-1.44 TaxID=1933779 RepID=UPI00097C2D63|nr:adenosine kinase [Actinosynnema sp. ALI-1.44]ONI81391.1 adenosine kinase [Actinosynnema sp. ALI-1.44]
MTVELDILGIGNAIVDVLSKEDESFIAAHSLTKGGMTLIDHERAHFLHTNMTAPTAVSGGSCANTVACAASLGGNVAYIGKVGDDELGTVFMDDIRSTGVEFRSVPAVDGPGTARSLIVVTPDGERTMNTYLGACVGLSPVDVDEELVSRAKVVFFEGYLWDSPSAFDAVRQAMSIAHAAGRSVAVALSDSECVGRHLAAFRETVANADILFANEAELTALTGMTTFEDALRAISGHKGVVVATRSEKGSVIARGDDQYEIPAEPVAQVVDSTGAGDAYAAGFLYGHTQGHDLPTCGRLGSVVASEVLSHLGSRPLVSLVELCAPILR